MPYRETPPAPPVRRLGWRCRWGLCWRPCCAELAPTTGYIEVTVGGLTYLFPCYTNGKSEE